MVHTARAPARNASAASVSGPLEFPFPEPPAAGDVIEVADGVHWVRMPLPFALDHINLWLVRDGDGWAIVDSGFNSDATRAAWDRILQRFAPVTRVIATHYHPDHMGLAGWLQERFGVALWTTEAEYLTAHAVYEGVAGYGGDALVSLFRAHGLDAGGLDAMRRRGNGYRASVWPLPRNFRRVVDGETFAIGEHGWRVIVGYGHAPEHAALHCPALGVLISGDMLLPKISTNTSVWSTEPEGDPVGQFLSSIRRFLELPADTLVLPAHGLPFRGIAARVAQLEAHHDARLAELREACAAAPRTAFEVLPLLFRRKLDTHQLFFAMGEAIAHLNRLVRTGAVHRLPAADGVYRFAATADTSAKG